MKKTTLTTALFCFVLATHAQNMPKLKMTDVVHSFSGKSDSIYVVNFWATFCKPCVAEIPGFIKTVNKYKKEKVKLTLVSLDLPLFYPTKIAAFAKKNNFNTNIAWLEETNADYFCPMIDKSLERCYTGNHYCKCKTGYKKFVEGDMKQEDFEKELKKAIADTKTALNNPIFVMPMSEVVSIEYGKEKYGDVAINNSSITFKSKDSVVWSVSDGVVSAVAKVDDIKVVIISKGNLFYTYSNLNATLVKRGDKIKANQKIGYASLDINKIMPTLDFYYNDNEKGIFLSRENFTARKGKDDTRFMPMLGTEPE